MTRVRWLPALGAALCLAAAADPADRLPNPADEARARAIFQETRCLVCQGQSIDDSDADLAGDLRKLIRAQVKAGRSDSAIRAFLVSRYGEFVLLRPPVSAETALLWGGPFAVALIGLCVLLFRRPRPVEAIALTEEEETKIAGLAESPLI
jgi:cytochrome c-type biogenesis protein CcmH